MVEVGIGGPYCTFTELVISVCVIKNANKQI